MKFSDYLVITNDGKVGELKAKINTEQGILYITDIPNEETPTTAYYEHEIELIEKSLFDRED